MREIFSKIRRFYPMHAGALAATNAPKSGRRRQTLPRLGYERGEAV